MKRVLVLTFAVLCGHQLTAAEPINSGVIHHYTELGIGYAFIDVEGGPEAHGVAAHTAVDMDNFLFDVNGGYVWADDVNTWSLGGGIGYVVRLMQNHINIIPRFGISYNKINPDDDIESDFTTISPGVAVSYAINNRASIGARYDYVRDIDFDNDEDLHTYGPFARIALAERIGLDLGATFAEGEGFVAAFAGLSFHF
jgi:opacity protein-like surface antigen